MVRALAWHARGHEFDSRILHEDSLLELSFFVLGQTGKAADEPAPITRSGSRPNLADPPARTKKAAPAADRKGRLTPPCYRFVGILTNRRVGSPTRINLRSIQKTTSERPAPSVSELSQAPRRRRWLPSACQRGSLKPTASLWCRPWWSHKGRRNPP